MTFLTTHLCHVLLLVLLATAPPVRPADIDGSWRSDGYGLFAEIDGNAMIVSEVSAISCLGAEPVRLTPSGHNRWSAERPSDDPCTLTLEPGSPERLSLRFDDTASSIFFVRSEAARPSFANENPVSPLYNFDVFCQVFAEHYPFFKLKGIDWSKQARAQRAKLNEDSTNRELFDAMVSMVEPLQDAHVYLEGDRGREYSGFRFDAYDTDDEDAFETRASRASEILELQYLTEQPREYANGNVEFVRLPGDVGLLRITSFSDFGDGTFAEQLRQFEAELDELFDEELKGLILDLRVNYGGSDNFGLAIARRLTTKAYLAYRKVARNDPLGPSVTTAPQASRVEPQLPGFAGPVVVLTSRYTISAGETFTQALMAREPEVVRVGQSTQGVFSDVLSRQLPNGWEFGLPNELFLDEHGHSFDGPGIEPHHAVPIFAQEDLDAAQDPALVKALDVLE